MKVLGYALEPGEITVYLVAKCVVGDKGAYPSGTEINRIVPGSSRVISKMKKKGLLPSGRIDMGRVDQLVAEALQKGGSVKPETPKDLQLDAAKVLTALLRQSLKDRGVSDLPTSWWVKNQRTAISALKDGVRFEVLESCISWIFGGDDFAKEYLAPNCDSMYKVLDYLPKFQQRNGKAQAHTTGGFSHDDLLQREEAV